MNAIKVALIMILGLNLVFSLFNWLNKEEPQTTQSFQALPEPDISAAEGLDLESLTTLVKGIRSGQELERKLNEKGGINNLDLNADEKVDYLFVKEFGNVENKIGYSLTVELAKDEVQEVASITVEPNKERAEIQVIGNEQIYGDKAIYNDWTPIEREKPQTQSGANQVPMYSSYFYPRPLWLSPWYFGFYPPMFSYYPIVHRSTYISQTSRYRNSTARRGSNTFQKNSGRQIQNPNRNKTANKGIARSLKKPTATQRKFQATRSKNLRSGGFGKAGAGRSLTSGRSTVASRSRSSGTSNRLGRSRSRSFSSRSSGFGTQRSSSSSFFGSRRGSFRSSSFGSRSFGFGK